MKSRIFTLFGLSLIAVACTNSSRTSPDPVQESPAPEARLEAEAVPVTGEAAAEENTANPQELVVDALPQNLNPENLSAVSDTLNSFGSTLFAGLSADENVLISPVSIGVAFHMVLAGADGATRQEIERALQVQGLGDQVHALSGALQRSLSASAHAQVNIANRMWVDGTWQRFILQPYVDGLARDYGGALETADFTNDHEVSRQRINGWVSEQTNEKIPELFGPWSIEPATRAVLANAVYFKADWRDAFDEDATRDRAFQTPAGEVQVPMMHREMNARYARVGDVQVLALPYTQNEWEMLVLLPDEGKLDALHANVGATIQSAMLALRGQQVNIQLPRFTFRWSASLVGYLQSLGIQDAFTTRADFSRMVNTEDSPGLMISDVIHEAFVEVNEKGTEAAAATGVAMVARGMPMPQEVVNFHVNRPFVFVLQHRATGTQLFLGLVLNPLEEG